MRKRILFPAALLLLVFSFVLSLCVGSAQISIREAVSALQNGSLTPDSRILFYVRLPRALAAVLSGAALAVSGVLLQNVLNNALAAPNIIGVNAGAGFAVLFLLAVFPVCSIPWRSFRVAAHLCRRGKKRCFPHNDHPRGRGLKQCFHRRQQRHKDLFPGYHL